MDSDSENLDDCDTDPVTSATTTSTDPIVAIKEEFLEKGVRNLSCCLSSLQEKKVGSGIKNNHLPRLDFAKCIAGKENDPY